MQAEVAEEKEQKEWREVWQDGVSWIGGGIPYEGGGATHLKVERTNREELEPPLNPDMRGMTGEKEQLQMRGLQEMPDVLVDP